MPLIAASLYFQASIFFLSVDCDNWKMIVPVAAILSITLHFLHSKYCAADYWSLLLPYFYLIFVSFFEAAPVVAMYKAANQYANVNSISCLTAIKRIRYRWKVIHQLYFIIPLFDEKKRCWQNKTTLWFFAQSQKEI